MKVGDKVYIHGYYEDNVFVSFYAFGDIVEIIDKFWIKVSARFFMGFRVVLVHKDNVDAIIEG